MRSSSLGELARVEQALGRTGRADANIRAAARYTEWCGRHRMRAFPPSYDSIAGFVAAEVHRLRGSTKSTANTVSSIKVFCDQLGVAWLTNAELLQLGRVRRQLVLEDTTPIRRRKPIVLSMLQRMARSHWDYKNDPYDLLCATMAFTAHNGLLRGGELLCGLQVKDLEWEPRSRSVTIHLDPTKTERSGAGVYVRLTDYPGLSAYKLLRRWIRTQHLETHGEYYIFPHHARRRRGSATRFDFYQPASKKWFGTVTSSIAHAAGHQSSHYSNHSYRAGGATDLFLCGVPYPQIKSYGRWKSDAALVYLRDDIEVSLSVAQAFGGGCSSGTHRRAVRGVGVTWEDR